ncbi:hypothetical protein Tco_1531610 [Tanacetum coccineum]
MEILPETTSNKLYDRRSGNKNSKYSEFNTSVLENPKLYAGNPVKKVLHKLNLSDHKSVLTEPEIHTRMVIPYSSRIELNNFKKDDYTNFQDKEKYEHAGPKVTSSQEGIRLQDDEKRGCMGDDLKKLKITYKSS